MKTGRSFGLTLWIEAVVLLLMALGTVFVFSAGANVNATYDWKNFYNFTTLRNVLFFPAAVFVMYFIARIDYRHLSFRPPAGRRGLVSRIVDAVIPGRKPDFGVARSFTPYLFVLSLVLLVAVLVIGQGIEGNREFARRWFRFSIGSVSLSFQPSELAKWTTLFFLAAFLDRYSDLLREWKRSLLIPFGAVGLVCVLIVTQDFGTAAFIGVMSLLVLLLGGLSWWWFVLPAMGGTAVSVLAYFTAPNALLTETRLNRINGYLARFFPHHFPEITIEGGNYQAQQSLYAISNGGLWGQGLGRGILKYGHLPEDTSDFIFAIICEELGFVGGVLTILLFVAFLLFGLLVVVRCRDRFGKLLAGGIVLAITLQAAINLGVVTVVLPTKGIPLPFISAGGTSMLMTAAAVGVLLNISQQVDEQTPVLVPDNEATELREHLRVAARREDLQEVRL